LAWAIDECNFAPQGCLSEYPMDGRNGNDTSAETYGEPQTPAELAKSSTLACLPKRVILSRGIP